MDNTPDDYQRPTCPYCGKDTECEHLFGLYDALDLSVVAGYLCELEEPILEIMKDYFREKIEKYGSQPDVFIEDSGFAYEIWLELLGEKEFCADKKEEFDIDNYFPVDLAVKAILDCSECYCEHAYEPWGPFLGSYFYYYTDEDLEEKYLAVKSSIRDYLELGINKNLMKE